MPAGHDIRYQSFFIGPKQRTAARAENGWRSRQEKDARKFRFASHANTQHCLAAYNLANQKTCVHLSLVFTIENDDAGQYS